MTMVTSVAGRPGRKRVAWISLAGLVLLLPVLTPAQTQPEPSSPAATAPEATQLHEQESLGSIRGTVVDPKGAPLAGAKVSLTREGKSLAPDVLTGDDGSMRSRM